ncbi:hypothetical protein [Xenorhabdus nematophila]|nr:hypothetical protein [Xenorhabdus nematophila]
MCANSVLGQNVTPAGSGSLAHRKTRCDRLTTFTVLLLPKPHIR